MSKAKSNLWLTRTIINREAMMRSILAISFTTVCLLFVTTSASALEDTFSKPEYKDGSRLDVCYGLGQDCGQRSADTWCRIQGYEKAARFETEPAQPTRVMGDGKRCDGAHCTGYKSIVCSTSAAKRGKQGDWPQKL
jgi:hypothetical protein